jgi:hypothetical protein
MSLDCRGVQEGLAALGNMTNPDEGCVFSAGEEAVAG